MKVELVYKIRVINLLCPESPFHFMCIKTKI